MNSNLVSAAKSYSTLRPLELGQWRVQLLFAVIAAALICAFVFWQSRDSLSRAARTYTLEQWSLNTSLERAIADGDSSAIGRITQESVQKDEYFDALRSYWSTMLWHGSLATILILFVLPLATSTIFGPGEYVISRLVLRNRRESIAIYDADALEHKDTVRLLIPLVVATLCAAVLIFAGLGTQYVLAHFMPFVTVFMLVFTGAILLVITHRERSASTIPRMMDLELVSTPAVHRYLLFRVLSSAWVGAVLGMTIFSVGIFASEIVDFIGQVAVTPPDYPGAPSVTTNREEIFAEVTRLLEQFAPPAGMWAIALAFLLVAAQVVVPLTQLHGRNLLQWFLAAFFVSALSDGVAKLGDVATASIPHPGVGMFLLWVIVWIVNELKDRSGPQMENASDQELRCPRCESALSATVRYCSSCAFPVERFVLSGGSFSADTENEVVHLSACAGVHQIDVQHSKRSTSMRGWIDRGYRECGTCLRA